MYKIMLLKEKTMLRRHIYNSLAVSQIVDQVPRKTMPS